MDHRNAIRNLGPPKPAMGQLALEAPKGKPSKPGGRQDQPDSPDRPKTVSTKLTPDEIAKLDRIGRANSRLGATRSATLRWLVQDFDEST